MDARAYTCTDRLLINNLLNYRVLCDPSPNPKIGGGRFV